MKNSTIINLFRNILLTNKNDISNIKEIIGYVNILDDLKDGLISNLEEVDFYEEILKTLKDDEKVKLTKNQLRVLSHLNNNNNVLVKKNRQDGITTLLALKVVSELIFNDVKIVYYVHNLSCRGQLIQLIENILNIVNNMKLFEVSFNIRTNRGEILLSDRKSSLTIKSSNCVELENNPDWVIFDESIYNSNSAMLYSRLKVYDIERFTLISSPYYADELFFPIFLLGEKANFNVIETKNEDNHLISEEKLNELKNMIGKYGYECEYNGKFIVKNNLTLDKLCQILDRYNIKGKTTISDLMKVLNYVIIVN